MYGDFPTYVIKVVEVCFSFARLCCKTFYPLIWIRSGYIKQLTRLLRKRRRQRIKLMAQNSLQKLVLEKWVGTIPAYFIVNFVSLSMRSVYCFIMLVIEITHCARSAVQISHQNKVTAKNTNHKRYMYDVHAWTKPAWSTFRRGKEGSEFECKSALLGSTNIAFRGGCDWIPLFSLFHARCVDGL